MTTQTTIPSSPSLQWRQPVILLILMVIAMKIAHDAWFAMMNNFAVHKAGFTGWEMGVQHSIREIPGFLAFGVVFVLLLMKEQTLAYLSLVFLAVGVGMTGFFPYELSIYGTTILMSIGFHYYETVAQSLALQWVDKKDAPQQLGKIMAAGSFAAIAAYFIIFIPDIYNLLLPYINDFAKVFIDNTTQFSAILTNSKDYPYEYVYLTVGIICLVIVVFCAVAFPVFPQEVEQKKTIVLKNRYWLYYALTFFGGARRQIFVVFAHLLMVQKFGYSVSSMTALFLTNHLINMFLAPQIGKLIGYLGERRVLTIEYIGLIIVFTSYAFVTNHYVAVGLYIFDHFFFAMAIAMKTYFQKIADPEDIAPTASVAFSINHVAAVFLPFALGFLWLFSPMMVFLIGALFACGSLYLSTLVPFNPSKGNEFRWKEQAAA